MIAETVTLQNVDMGKIAITHNPGVLVSRGLGSCIGLAIFDTVKRIGGLAHIMLSKSRLEDFTQYTEKDLKYADVAIYHLVTELKKLGCMPEHMEAKMAGGAHMFPNLDDDIMKVGKNNRDAIVELLPKYGIKLLAEDCGGNLGRTVTFDLSQNTYKVTTKEKEYFI